MSHTSFLPVSIKASPGFPPLLVPLLAVGKGKPLLFQKTRVTANQDCHKAREEAAIANRIRMRTQLRGGDPGLARQMQAGRSPPRRGGKNCCVALHAQAQLSWGSIETGPLPSRTVAAIRPYAVPQFRHSTTVSTANPLEPPLVLIAG